MAEFNIRTDSVDVEQIMRQIRARINEKRGVDYTEQQIQELANVKLERFLDPKGVRSDLVDQFKRTRGTSPEPPNYSFEDTTIYETHRGLIRFFRKLLNPLLKLLFNPNPITHVLHMQGQINNINAQQFRVREELDALYYEVIHNLVLEVTRLGIETKNLKMRLESLNSRIDFDERRARALEGVVQYRPGSAAGREPPQPRSSGEGPRPYVPQPRPAPQQNLPARQAPIQPLRPQPLPPAEPEQPEQLPLETQPTQGPAPAAGEQPGDPAGTARRRRRRRRGRRGGRGRGVGETPGETPGEPAGETAAAGAPSEDDGMAPPHGDPTAEAALGSPDSDSAFDSGEDEGPDSAQ
jgi:hypothetical protein